MGAQGCKADCACDQDSTENDIRAMGPEESKEVVDVSMLTQQAPESREAKQTQDTPSASPSASPQSPGPRLDFEVQLVRAGNHWRTLGLLVSPDDDPKYLVIDDIWEPSLVFDWNAAQESDAARVQPRDLICSVNDSTCDGEGMLGLIQRSGKGSSIKLLVRPSSSMQPTYWS